MDVVTKSIARLSALGYAVADDERPVIEYAVDKAKTKLCTATNLTEIPEGLFYTWVDMAAGLFLSDKLATGALDGDFDFSAAPKSIKQGDTEVTYAVSDKATPRDAFAAVLAKMVTPDKDIIAAYRRLKW